MENNKHDWTELFDEYEEKMKEDNYYMNNKIEERKLPGANIFNKRKTLRTNSFKLPKLTWRKFTSVLNYPPITS